MLIQNKIKISIIEDDEDDFFIITRYLNEIEGVEFITDWCNNYQAAVDQIRSEAHDIYLLDYRLGSKTGLDLLREVSCSKRITPLILLTGKGNREVDMQAMKLGVTDYIVKSELNSEKLERCIRYSLDRAATLKALKESEKKYRNLFESSRDALFIANNFLVFQELNDSATEFFGCSNPGHQCVALFDFIPDPAVKEQITDILFSGKNIDSFELIMENSKKEKRNCVLSVLVESRIDGDNLLHGTITDITNIKKAEEINLQSAKLAANERLVRILAHEIRNPLNNIQLSVENLALFAGSDTMEKPMVDIIQRNVDRINKLITELLKSTKTLDLSFEKQSLQDVVEESLSSASDRLNLQKINLRKNYYPKPLLIKADKLKLQIAFSNILINAIEAMENENGQLCVSVDKAREHYRVCIEDNGRGIPAENMPQIFEPFFSMKKNGLGLGLSAAYGIFQSHDVHLQVESVPDSGTKFIMDFKSYEE
jgi:PAS domain S-box-containing protein